VKTDKLYKGLTPTQRRRVEMRADGMTWREIAEVGSVTVSAIQSSLELAEIKIKKNLGITPRKSTISDKNTNVNQNHAIKAP
jgi:DNA-directed RNA polymerase specialized sigma24 family protein